MILSKNDWHYRFLVFAQGDPMYYQHIPNNLCPYFWKVVVNILILVLTIPFNPVGYLFLKVKNEGYCTFRNFIIGVGVYISCLILFSMVDIWFITMKPKLEDLEYMIVSMGSFGYLITIIILIAYIDISLMKKRLLVKKPNILVEFIKAKKNKYCPKIEWKD